MDWRLADAKNKLSEVVTLALTRGPQRVMRRDRAVIIVSEDEYDRLRGQRKGFKEHLLSRENRGDIPLTRDRSPMRDVKL